MTLNGMKSIDVRQHDQRNNVVTKITQLFTIKILNLLKIS